MPDHPVKDAAAAGLRYVTDAEPGLTRRRAGMARVRALAIPPAWTHVWICAHPDGHLQATGRDARGRKQYRYHPRWREVRDETKYGRMAEFAAALPRIRRRVKRDLALPGLPRRKVLATIVRLLETTRIRVGNEEYARQNNSFGLTTLRARQVEVRGATLSFRFRGKSGVQHDVALSDRRLAAIVRRMRDLPGYELFQYVDDEGKRCSVDSADVNDYLREAAGEAFTSKDFRTWAGTVLAAQKLSALGSGKLSQAIEEVARHLGNTKAVCRKCYIHPAVIDAYLDGSLAAAMCGARAEACVLRLLRGTALAGRASATQRRARNEPVQASRRRGGLRHRRNGHGTKPVDLAHHHAFANAKRHPLAVAGRHPVANAKRHAVHPA